MATNLLGEDVEGVAREACGLDVALVHGTGDGGAGDQVGPVLGKENALADGVDVSGRRGRCAACRWRPRAALRSG